MPASMCGVVGYKPRYGRNPQSPELSLDMFMHLGPMTRTVADAALMQNVMSGHQPVDHAGVRQKVRLALQPQTLHGLKIAYPLDLGAHELSEDVANNTMETVHRLSDPGAGA